MLRRSVRDFLERKVESRYADFDTPLGYELAPGLLEEMGALGFLGIGVPEAYGGYEADFRTQLVFGEVAYSAWSFGLSIGVQTSLGVAPLLLYGNEAQKAKYLPGIVTAQIKSCYCLTEPGAGSDANSGKTHAVLSADGSHYLLNGQKMWITASGYADLFFVFAKIGDDENLSCLIVEKAFGGIRLGAEEKKMGIRGSSTRQVFFEDVRVPVENLLGQRNGGFKIALNVLNTGRIKMATSVTGNAKRAFQLGVGYARERRQFGQPIANFGAIRHKIGESAALIYAMEAVAYRIGGQIDRLFATMVESGMDRLQAKYRSIAELAVECAIAKVHNTEAEHYVIDEALQIHGGMGFSAETQIETLYRNARINRIYEGTNEINRLLIVDMLLRKAGKGELQLTGPILAVAEELKTGKVRPAERPDGMLAAERQTLANLKKAALLLTGVVSRHLATLKQEQEMLLQLADICIQIYTLESAILRTLKFPDHAQLAIRADLVALLSHRAARVTEAAGREILYASVEGKELKALLGVLSALAEAPPVNLKAARRRVADAFRSGLNLFDY